MSFITRELSAFFGAPVEIFDFIGELGTFRYTSSNNDEIVYNGNTYERIPIKRDKIEFSQDINKSPLNITLSREAELTDLFRDNPPTGVFEIIVRRFHFGDSTADPDNVVTLWQGRIVNIKYLNNGSVVIRGESLQTSMRRALLRRFYQPNCPYVLYGNSCTVDETAYKTDVTLSSVSGITLVSSGFNVDSPQYIGGFIIFSDPLNFTTGRRYIKSHSGDTITIERPSSALEIGTVVEAYPGCTRTMEICRSRFSNLDNYGGFPYMPNINPFGNPIF
jgi:uncharacterized phage protein (TIGR02218 family)